MNTGNLFSGLKNAKTYKRGVWLKPGIYEVRVGRAIYKVTRTKGHAYILEFTVEKSNYESEKKKALDLLAGQPFNLVAELEKLLPNAPGSKASWYQSLQDMDIGFGALKGYVAAILGVNPEDKEFIEQVEGFLNETVQGNALQNMLIPVEVISVKTKSNKDFSRHNWGKIVDESQRQAAHAVGVLATP